MKKKKRTYIKMWVDENVHHSDVKNILRNFGPKLDKKYGCGIKHGVIFSKEYYAEFYLPPEELERISKKTKDYFSKKSRLHAYLHDCDVAIHNLTNYLKILQTLKMSSLSDREYTNVSNQFAKNISDLFVCYYMTQPERLAAMESTLTSYLEKKGVENLEKTRSFLLKGKETILFSKKGNLLMNASFAELLQKETAKIDVNLVDRKLYQLKKTHQTTQQKLIKQLNPPKSILALIETMQILGTKRFEMRFFWMMGVYYAELFPIETKRRTHIQKKDISFYTEEEFLNLIAKRKTLTKTQIHERQKGLFVTLTNDHFRSFLGTEAEKQFKAITEQIHLNVLKGAIASPGYAIGKAILLSYKKPHLHGKRIKNMKKGDIIVTEMTRPNIVLACEKAGAIVTDEGGVTSHAAIISREFRTPCVIGTQHATSWITHGSYVCVNADEGTVKKSSQKEYLEFLKQKKKGPLTNAKKHIISLETKTDRKEQVVRFEDIDHTDISLVGGKGANLGTLFGTAPVPEGFCVTVHAYQSFLEKGKLIEFISKTLKKIDPANTTQLNTLSKMIRDHIIKTPLPTSLSQEILHMLETMPGDYFAVRSSATAEDLPTTSFAGQQSTYLNVKGTTHILKALQNCWASLFTSEAIFYREANGIDHAKVKMAVVIQRMVNAQKAGVMFTANPATQKRNEIIIEGSFGLGEAVVSGEVTPDYYRLEKSSLKILESSIKEKKLKIVRDGKKGKNKTVILKGAERTAQVLSITELQALGKLAKKIEKTFGYPQDIEWAIENEVLFITQSRAITNLI